MQFLENLFTKPTQFKLVLCFIQLINELTRFTLFILFFYYRQSQNNFFFLIMNYIAIYICRFLF